MAGATGVRTLRQPAGQRPRRRRTRRTVRSARQGARQDRPEGDAAAWGMRRSGPELRPRGCVPRGRANRKSLMLEMNPAAPIAAANPASRACAPPGRGNRGKRPPPRQLRSDALRGTTASTSMLEGAEAPTASHGWCQALPGAHGYDPRFDPSPGRYVARPCHDGLDAQMRFLIAGHAGTSLRRRRQLTWQRASDSSIRPSPPSPLWTSVPSSLRRRDDVGRLGDAADTLRRGALEPCFQARAPRARPPR